MGVSIHQNKMMKLHEVAKNKRDGVWTRGRYFYATKQGRVVLIADRFTGEAAAVSGGFLISRGQHPTDKIKQLLAQSI